MEPDLKITLGQRPASCESPPSQNGHGGPPGHGEKHLGGQLAAPSQTWEVRCLPGGASLHVMVGVLGAEWGGQEMATAMAPLPLLKDSPAPFTQVNGSQPP